MAFARREFLKNSVLGSMGAAAVWSQLPRVTANEVAANPKIVQFSSDIEPLVQLLETTPREDVVDAVIKKIRSGVSYQQLLAALQLAGVRNVQPRPSVGFKFHSVLVVNSAHIASLASPDDQRWLPILWAVDYFKSAQAQDERENNWTMAPVNEAAIPAPVACQAKLVESLDKWDEEAADAAMAGWSRSGGATRIFDTLVHYGARDFRSIGHKAIFVANAWRTLQAIGWRHAEPILRSLVYAMLNYDGDNPAQADHLADRPGRENLKRVGELREGWLQGTVDDGATTEMLQTIRSSGYQEPCELAVKLINRGVSVQSIWDAVFAASSEMLMRQPGIVSLHTLTTSNALHYAFQTCGNDETRKFLLLQNLAFLPLFRAEMERRGAVSSERIDDIEPSETSQKVEPIFDLIGKDNSAACRQTLSYLTNGGDIRRFMDEARVLIFQKGTDSHDYKFSSAVLEDYYQISPKWRDRCLATSVFKLRGTQDRDNQLMEKAVTAIKA